MEKLRISENGRYFVLPDGTPFSWLADTNWTIPQRMKWDDVKYLMKKRKEQGFTVLQIVALDPERDVEMRSPAGEHALYNGDLSQPNEAYFTYLDKVLKMAEEYGLYVLLLPVWGQLVVGDNWSGEIFEKTVTEKNAYDYGCWIARRYQNQNNVLWCLGGDRQPIHKGIDYRPIWRMMAEGIAKGLTGKDLKYNIPTKEWKEILMTYHTCYEMETGKCSTMSYWTDEEAWIRFIMLQSGHGLTPKNYELVKKEYDRSVTMPVWDGEPAYEMMPTSWPIISSFHDSWMVRRRAYWSLLSGAFGFTYGHASVWCSVSENERNEMNPYTWYEALSAEGAGQMRYLRTFMDQTQCMTGTPAQELLLNTENQDDLEQHIQVLKSGDGSVVYSYLPSGGEIRLHLTGFTKNTAIIYWYNPRNGQFCMSNGIEAKDGEQRELTEQSLTLKAPSEGIKEDWILMISAEKMNLDNWAKVDREELTKKEQKKVFDW